MRQINEFVSYFYQTLSLQYILLSQHAYLFMTLYADGYQFKPHEQPIMLGSPASPEHPKSRRIAYFIIALWLAIAAGLQNGIIVAAQMQLRGALGLDLLQDGWIQVSYYMTYACMSIALFKLRQHFGMRWFVYFLMSMTLLEAAIQWQVDSFAIQLIARGLSGLVANGLMVTALFYFMQAMPSDKKLAGAMLSLGVMLATTPAGQLLVPWVFDDGRIEAVFALSPIIALISVGLMIGLPLPPSDKKPSITWLDCCDFLLFAGGIALICAFLVLGRIVWWTTDWLGYLLAGGITLTGTALLIESRRQNPMLDLSWLSMPQVLYFAFVAAWVRLLISEQTVGAAGLMTTLGMSSLQMTGFYGVILGASLLGVLVSLIRFDINDIRRPVMIALLGLAIGAYLDTGVSVQTRPEQMYISQGIIAFSALYFLGPMLLEGLARAMAKSNNHIMSFSAIFGLSQSVGGLLGAALFSAFVTVQTRSHLSDMATHLTLTNPIVTTQLQQTARSYVAYANDAAVLQSQSVSQWISNALREATVLAFNDLFWVICVIASVLFVYAALVWGYRRYKKIDILAEEKRRLAAVLKP